MFFIVLEYVYLAWVGTFLACVNFLLPLVLVNIMISLSKFDTFLWRSDLTLERRLIPYVLRHLR